MTYHFYHFYYKVQHRKQKKSNTVSKMKHSLVKQN